MDSIWVPFIVLFLVASVGLGGMLAGVLITSNNAGITDSLTKSEMQSAGFTVITKGFYASTAITVPTANYTYFINSIPPKSIIYETEMNPDSHYNPNLISFIYIFNDTYALAYQPYYRAPFWWVWG
jgi:hypothetical protein